jgi:predicted phage baseplate assembly protein
VVFGDGTFDARPPETSTVTAKYRVGGGAMGNVGADTLALAHPDVPAPWLISVTNPLPATGGRDLESRDHARRVGPATFHQPLVAVSAADYEAAAVSLAQGNARPVIQRANANFRWTGSWLTVTVAADPLAAEGLTPGLRQELSNYLDSKRLAGYDLEVTGPIYVPIDLEIAFATAAGAQQADVEQSILQTLGNGTLPGGAKGFFHPDNFTFGSSVFVSKIFAAVMAVPGVQSARITRLARSHAAHPDQETATNLARGFLSVGIDQIVRLDNDRNFPQSGTLAVRPQGALA